MLPSLRCAERGNVRLLQYLSDNQNANSLAVSFRKRRFAFFRSLIEALPEWGTERRISILDLGGTRMFWEQMGFANEAVDITILNISPGHLELGSQEEERGTRYSYVQGDACDLKEYEDDAFDIVFSNSVIEHVGDTQQQTKMLSEAKRVGKRYFVQTPNFFFPIEPHFHVPGFQFLPFPGAAGWCSSLISVGMSVPNQRKRPRRWCAPVTS